MKHLQRNLFIGLGGIGIKTIVETKAQFLNHCSQNGALPSGVEFLGVDTDMTALDYSVSSKCGEVCLSPRERYYASVFNAREYCYAHKSELTWIPKQNVQKLVPLTHGSGMVRSNGRFAFMYHHRNLFEHIWHSLDYIMYNKTGSSNSVNVHMVFSLCGGTGSGMFLDVAYLICEIARQRNWNIHLKGYGVLPGVFMSEIPYPHICELMLPNTYAALRELDYLMSPNSLAENGIQMPWMDNSTSEAPFDSVVLVDNVNARGLSYGMSDLIEMLSIALMTSATELGNIVSDRLKFEMLFKEFDIEDKCAWVSSMGISAITYDGDKVAKIYGLKAQNKLIQELLAVGDCNAVANYWIDMVRIRENHGRDQVIDYLYDLQGITAPTLTRNDFDKHTVVEKINNKMRLYSQYYQLSAEEWNAKVDALYETTKMAMIEKEEELCKSSLGNVISFLQEVKRQIADCFQKEMNDELLEHNQARNDAEADYDSMVAQLAAYLKSGLFHPKTDTFISAIKRNYQVYLLEDLEVKRRYAAIEFYAKMVEFIDCELAKHHSTIEKLESIQMDNTSLIHELQYSEIDRVNPMLINLADNFIRNVELKDDANILALEFITKLPGQSLYQELTKEYYQTALDEVTANLKARNAFLNLTVDEILNDTADLKDLIKHAANYSTPLMRFNDRGYLLHDGQLLGRDDDLYICVPAAATSHLHAPEFYKYIIDMRNGLILNVGINDCIIMYRQSRPVPVFAIDGIDRMEMACAGMQSVVSSYIDENLYKRMEDEHFSIFPSKNLTAEENEYGY